MPKNGWLLVCTFFIQVLVTAQKPLKIICVGGSLTYGEGVVNRTKNSFPNQLQYLLGKNFSVLNLGNPNAVTFSDDRNAYQKSVNYKEALKAHADIIIFNFGTNESGFSDQSLLSHFENSYASLIASFRNENKKSRIILLKAPPAFIQDTTMVKSSLIPSVINPVIEKLSYKFQTEIVDLYSTFIDRPDLFPDGINLSSLGASIIARHLYDILQLPDQKELIPIKNLPTSTTISSFYGYEQLEFKYNSRDCRIVKPKRVAKSHPWIWRARFWGHEPQTDIALLERGFHLVYCDVAELYGNKESIVIWDAFYALMNRLGLSDKPVLEAMSRGGIYAYNWAMANPDKVAAIYADAPVLDLKSWPGGKGKGPGSVYDWDLFKKDYALSELEASQFSGSPLDRTNEIIRSTYPILHVVGDADEVVPVDENTGPFEERLIKGGRKITVIHKPGVKHHPHSLANPKPIVDFILRATGHKTNFANLPAPSGEYRSAAGWKEGADWWKQQEDINDLLLINKKLDILFIGNSITQGIGGERPNVTYKPGKRIFDSVFLGYKYVSAGISGDRTQQILWRLQNGPIKNISVKWIVLTIGVNNFSDDEPEEIVAGIRSAIEWLRKYKPNTSILLSGPLPAGMNDQHPYRKKYEAVHQLLSKQDHQGAIYLPLSDQFILKNGDMNPQLYSSDCIHLLENGYARWARAIKLAIEKNSPNK